MTVTAEKLDLFKAHAEEYVAHEEPQLVRVTPATHIAIQGSGEPGGGEFTRKLSTLYSVAYTIKMACRDVGLDFVVPRLEGLWWEDVPMAGPTTPRDTWHWQLLLRVPGFVGHHELRAAVYALEDKGRGAGVRDVTIEALHEGLCVQALHVGPYADEPETVRRMEAVAAESHLQFDGRHHEIYLSDPLRVPPESLRTIIRYPVTVLPH